MDWLTQLLGGGIPGGEGMAPMNLPPAPVMPPQPIEAATNQIAGTLAANNVAPPGGGGGDGSLGAALQGPVPMPQARPAGLGVPTPAAPGTPLDLAPPGGGGGAPKPGGDRLAEALRGVRAPPAPAVQRIVTPAAPRPHGQVSGGGILQLLQSLHGGTAAPRQLPSTLGSALGGR